MRVVLQALVTLVILQPALVACGDDPEVERAEVERRKDGSARPLGEPDSVGPDTGAPDVADATDTTQATDTTIPGDVADTSDAVDTTDTLVPVDTADTLSPADTDVTNDVGTTGPVDLGVPSTLAIPWVAAGAGSSSLAVDIDNRGVWVAVTVAVLDASDIRVQGAPVSVDVGQSLQFTLRFDGAAAATVRQARLRIDATPQGAGATATRYEATVFAVTGSVLPATSWTALAAGTTAYGRSTTVRLASAPFPDNSGAWTDDSVNVFVPSDYIDRGPVHYVVHFHGHGTTLASTLPYHKYREQLWASGVNAVLVTPQGPVNAASGNFGKLMRQNNLAVLLRDVTSILYRDRIIKTPLTGDVTLTEHSGGYQAVAANLEAVFDEGLVLSAHLFDGLYASSAAYEAFARVGGFLRSNHTAGGGTRSNNQALLATLGNLATSAFTGRSLRDKTAVIWPTIAAHNDATWWNQAFSEALRWGSFSARRGPRIELRSAIANAGTATVTWLSPDDDWTTAHLVETSVGGNEWSVVARVDPSTQRATFALPGDTGVYVRVVPEVEDVAAEDALPSRSAYVHNGSPVLVVDGFDRIFGGSWTDLRHDHAARVARLGQAATASNEAVAEGEVDLTDFPVVIWLVGDESVADQTFDATERAVASAYLDAGGALIVSGSEVAYELRNTGATFLTSLGAIYAADDANQNSVKGVGPLAAIASFAFGTSASPYIEDFPDVLTTASGATIILRYGNDMVAGVGRAGKSAVLGFPLETIESDAALTTLIDALITFVAP
jgi:hypothetical protein